jgi:phosphoglycerate dehydrogenase-like enzyme
MDGSQRQRGNGYPQGSSQPRAATSRPAPLHVHLENLSSKPPVLGLTPELVRAARRRNGDLSKKARFTVGEDFTDLGRQLATAEVLVTSSDAIRDPRFPRAHLAAAAPRLRMIHLIGAGVEGVLPLDWLPEGVRLTNNSGVHVEKAREFLTMALLALNARLPAIVHNQQRTKWTQIFTPVIRGKRLAVIGLGDLGGAAVAAGRSLGLEIVGVRRSGKATPGVKRVYRPSQIGRAVRMADFIVVAAPLTRETRNLLSREVLEAAKPGVGLINVGRAALLDHAALVDLLTKGHVSGAVLDVFSPEPLPPDSPLWSAPNLIVSPHVSSDDADAYMAGTMDLVCSNVRRLIAGRQPENVVQAERGY